MNIQLGDSSFNKILGQLTEKFTCFICIDLADDPVTTPCCGQIVCKNCINSWLATNVTCPYCRQGLSKEKLISVQWAANLKRILQLLKQTNLPEHCCNKHNKAYEFYCQSCTSYLCSDCLYEELRASSANHKSHQIVKLKHILASLKTQIQKELKETLPKMTIIENNLNSIIIQNAELTKSRDSVLMEMFERLSKIKNQIETDFHNYEAEINTKLDALTIHKKELEGQINTVQKILSSGNPINRFVIDQQFSKFEAIKEASTDSAKLSDPNLLNELIPPFNDVPIYIPKFRETTEQYKKMPEEACHFFYTDKIKIGGNVWRIKIYPDGNLNGKGTHLSVFIELVRGCGVPSTYYYKLEIKSLNNDQSMNITRQYTSEFVESDSWGWNKAAALDSIFNGNFIDNDGGLVMILSIRPESYFQVNRDWQMAIQIKKEKYKRLKMMKNQPDNDQTSEQVSGQENSQNPKARQVEFTCFVCGKCMKTVIHFKKLDLYQASPSLLQNTFFFSSMKSRTWNMIPHPLPYLCECNK